MQVTDAIILAGGLGRRLRAVVPNQPKPMALVRGRPFLEYLLEAWIARGISRFILSVGYRAECIIDHFGLTFRGATLVYVRESSPLGTGGALRAASAALPAQTPFFAMNGDTFFDLPVGTMVAAQVRTGSGLTLALAPRPAGDRYGNVTFDSAGRILALMDGGTSSPWINGGVYLFAGRDLLDQLAEGPLSFENDVLPAWIDAGLGLTACPFPGRFIDIGVPEDFHAAQDFFAAPPRVKEH
jgi:D-glycero-alpha-D-manno-heptose 1-phosphate guanylyltransferase